MKPGRVSIGIRDASGTVSDKALLDAILASADDSALRLASAKRMVRQGLTPPEAETLFQVKLEETDMARRLDDYVRDRKLSIGIGITQNECSETTKKSHQGEPLNDNTKTLQAERTPIGSCAPEITPRDRIRGSLLAGAVGDALGAPVEFMDVADIRRQFGTGGIADYVPCYGRIGAITDDTQMTLFTAEGLLRAYVRSCLRGICSVTSVVSHAYLRWLKTQDFEPPRTIDENSWLLALPALHSRRAPGNTCLSALKSMTAFTDQKAGNASKGAGGIMRVAPVAMMFQAQPDEAETVFCLGKEAAWITHGHPSGYYSAAAFAVILHAVLVGESLDVGINRADKLLEPAADAAETRAALALGVELARRGMSPAEAIPMIGEAWVGEEALGMAVYCALVADNLEQGIRIAVNHSGDSDTTGILVGQLLGARYGEAAIPERWLAPLELRAEIGQIADDLHQHGEWNLDPYDYDEAIVQRYPGF